LRVLCNGTSRTKEVWIMQHETGRDVFTFIEICLLFVQLHWAIARHVRLTSELHLLKDQFINSSASHILRYQLIPHC
jgi:hypothetical protein